MPVVCSAASSQYVQVVQFGLQRLVLAPKLHRVAIVEFFRFIDVWRDVLLAVVVILVIIFRPGGLFQGLTLLPSKLKRMRSGR